MNMNVDGALRPQMAGQAVPSAEPRNDAHHGDANSMDQDGGKDAHDGNVRIRLAEHAWRILDTASDPNPRLGGRLGDRRGRIVLHLLDCASKLAEKYTDSFKNFHGMDVIGKKSIGRIEAKQEIEAKAKELRRHLPLMNCINDISSTISALLVAVFLGSSRELAAAVGARVTTNQTHAECQTEGQQHHYSALFNPLSGFTDKELIDELHRRAAARVPPSSAHMLPSANPAGGAAAAASYFRNLPNAMQQ